jgi:ABC-2 type transport system permease protein
VSTTRTIWLVARRELRERAATKGYLIGTGITLLLVVGLIVGPTLFGGDGGDDLRLGVVGDVPAEFEPQLVAATPEDTEVAVSSLADRDAAILAIEDGEIDAALVDRTELVADGQPDATLRGAVEAALRTAALTDGLADAGLDADEAAAALTPPPPLQTVDLAGDIGGDVDAYVLAFIATILLFIGIQGNSATLLSAAIEEKTSRVIEVLVSVARPWQLLAGKLIALTVLALVQLGLTVAAALAANAAVGAFELPDATGALIAISLLMLVVGFLFYASLFAVAGSMAASLEDAQSTSGPLTFAVMGGYFAVIFAVLPNPDGILAQVLTFLPPTAPFVVPARMAFGAITGWEVAVATALTLVASLLVVRLAGRLYAGSLLAGGKLTWAAAWRAEPVR